MLKLNRTLSAWNTDTFNDVFLQEICALDADTLPLQQGLLHSSYANSDSLSAMVLSAKSDDNTLFVKAGLFYTGIIAGCNCADDPTPVEENNEYCEVLFCVDRETAETTVTLES
jgi:hypothetical protein